jgi:hypothetical protein
MEFCGKLLLASFSRTLYVLSPATSEIHVYSCTCTAIVDLLSIGVLFLKVTVF